MAGLVFCSPCIPKYKKNMVVETGIPLHQALVRIAEAAVAIDTRAYEISLETVSKLVEELLDVANDATNTLGRLSEALETGGIGTAGAQLSATCDVAFMAHWDLRQRTDRIASYRSSREPWLVIAECAALRGHIIKSLVQVEQLLAREVGATPHLAQMRNSDLEIALASRRAYLNFIRRTRAVEARVSRADSNIEHALRLSAANIAILIGRSIYQDLRVADRRQVRSLQTRIITAVQAPMMDQLGARRLWMDICAFAQLLTRVHDRAELVENDFEFLAGVLASVDDTRTLSRAQLEQLDQLEGRDPDLDGHLAENTNPTGALYDNLVALYDRLAITLGRPLFAAPTTAKISEHRPTIDGDQPSHMTAG